MFGEDGLGQFEHFPSQLEVGRILFLLLFLGFFVGVVLGIAGACLVGADRLVVFDSFGTFLNLLCLLAAGFGGTFFWVSYPRWFPSPAGL